MSTPDADKPFLSTIWAADDPQWNEQVEVIDWRRYRGLPSWTADLVRRARGRRAVILRGTVTWHDRYRDLVGAVALKTLPRRSRPLVVISDATIEPGSRALSAKLGPLAGLLPVLSRLLIRAVDGEHVRWCVLSSQEVGGFARTWGVPERRVLFTPFTHTLHHEPEPAAPADPAGGYFFAGGNSLRDYDLLAEAAAGTGLRVVIASSWGPRHPVAEVSARYVPHDEYLTLMRGALAGVVPIRESSRSAGQQTYLNTMLLAKPTIVTDAMGVRDHVQDGVTGVVVPPTVEALRAALLRVADPAAGEQNRRMGERARAAVLEQYTPAAYRGRLLQVAGLSPAPAVEPA